MMKLGMIFFYDDYHDEYTRLMLMVGGRLGRINQLIPFKYSIVTPVFMIC